MFHAFLSKRIATIDEKERITLLRKIQEGAASSHLKQECTAHEQVLIVDHFLTADECDEIVAACEREPNFVSLEYNHTRRQRMLVFEDNNELQRRMEERLAQHVNLPDAAPCGFSASREWVNTGKINDCFRISKYSAGDYFPWHRDSQHTRGLHSRSNLSLIVYLNDTRCGGTEFLTPDSESNIQHCGWTVKEELSQHRTKRSVIVEPAKGRAVIFDQKLLHRGLPCKTEKYVLRTDLMCSGTLKNDPEFGADQVKLMELTQRIFRQAQLHEMQGDDALASKCYEVASSLRVAPHRMCEYPAHLESLLVEISADVQVLGSNDLTLVERSGQQCTYRWSGALNDALIKLAACFSLLMATVDLTEADKGIHRLFDELLQKTGLSDLLEDAHVSEGDCILRAQVMRLPKQLRKQMYIDYIYPKYSEIVEARRKFDLYRESTCELDGDFDDMWGVARAHQKFCGLWESWTERRYGVPFPFEFLHEFGDEDEDHDDSVCGAFEVTIDAVRDTYLETCQCGECRDDEEKWDTLMPHPRNNMPRLVLADVNDLQMTLDKKTHKILFSGVPHEDFNHAGCQYRTAFVCRKNVTKSFALDVEMEYSVDVEHRLLIIKHKPYVVV